MMTTFALPGSSVHSASRRLGFSLVEVVIALGIFAFVAVALVGLFSVGINTNRESIEELEATNLVQSFFAARRAAPVAPVIARCPLPRFDEAAAIPASAPLLVKADGSTTTVPGEARFGLIYDISPPDTTRKFTTVRVCLLWPPQAKPGKASGYYEVASSFLLP